MSTHSDKPPHIRSSLWKDPTVGRHWMYPAATWRLSWFLKQESSKRWKILPIPPSPFFIKMFFQKVCVCVCSENCTEQLWTWKTVTVDSYDDIHTPSINPHTHTHSLRCVCVWWADPKSASTCGQRRSTVSHKYDWGWGSFVGETVKRLILMNLKEFNDLILYTSSHKHMQIQFADLFNWLGLIR